MFWQKKDILLTLPDGSTAELHAGFKILVQEITDLRLRVHDLEKDNDRLSEEVEDLNARELIFRTGLNELTDPEFSVKYDPPCPQCGNDDHYNMIAGQPCRPTQITP